MIHGGCSVIFLLYYMLEVIICTLKKKNLKKVSSDCDYTAVTVKDLKYLYYHFL